MDKEFTLIHVNYFEHLYLDDYIDTINIYDNIIIVNTPKNYYYYYFYKICDTVKSILDSYVKPYEI